MYRIRILLIKNEYFNISYRKKNYLKNILFFFFNLLAYFRYKTSGTSVLGALGIA